MLIAGGIGVIAQLACQEGLDDLIGIACNPAVGRDTTLFERLNRPGTNAAADEGVHPQGVQNPRQSAVTGAIAGRQLGGCDLSALNIVEFERLRLAKCSKTFPSS